MLKYSLGTLLGVVALTGLGCAALVNYSERWVQIMFAVTIVLLATAAMAGLAGGGRARPFAAGFAIVGGAYFLLAFLMTPELREERLVTSRTIDWLHALQRNAEAASPPADTMGNVATSDAGMTGSMFLSPSDGSMYGSSMEGSSDYSTMGSRMMTGMGMAMPGAAPVMHPAPREVKDIGHCLWALILGAFAGALAQAIHRKAARSDS